MGTLQYLTKCMTWWALSDILRSVWTNEFSRIIKFCRGSFSSFLEKLSTICNDYQRFQSSDKPVKLPATKLKPSNKCFKPIKLRSKFFYSSTCSRRLRRYWNWALANIYVKVLSYLANLVLTLYIICLEYIMYNYILFTRYITEIVQPENLPWANENL